MSRFRTAYDTLACNGFVLDKLNEGIKRAIINQRYSYPEVGNNQRTLVIDSLDESVTIPAFIHPVMEKVMNGQEMAIVDCRPFVRFEARNGATSVKNVTEYLTTVRYGDLTSAWVGGKRRQMRDISPAATSVFASWISENISRRFALTPREQLDLAILAALYYQGLFSDTGDNEEMTEREYNGLVATVARAVRVQATEVFEFVDRLQLSLPISGISDFCGLAYEVTGSIRLKDFNPGVMFAIVGGTWFGTNAREMTAVALEYPPAFLTILSTALTEKSYRNAGIAKIAERLNAQEAKVLLSSLSHVIANDN